MGLTAKNFGLQEHINISQPQGNTTNYENGMGYHTKRDRCTERERKREGECSALWKRRIRA